MSIVPDNGILRLLYQEAVEDIEDKSFRFWQAWLHRAFQRVGVYSVLCGMSPDDSLRLIDAVAERYDAEHDTLSPMLLIECKRPSDSVGQVEEQALDAADRCIRHHNLERVYLMTTVGVSFRTWEVVLDSDDGAAPVLKPFHGGPADATGSQYIDADSVGAEVLMAFVDRVKNYPPVRIGPVVPN